MSDEKTIFRVVKDKENPFVMIDRRVLENPVLSWKAKGLLAYLLSRPDNWKIIMGDLIKRSTDGEFATRKALNELVKVGHIIKVEEREKGRFLSFSYEVHEKPQPVSENQEMAAEPFGDFPQVEKPHAENRSLNNTDLNDIKNTEGGKKTPPSEFGLAWQLAAGVEEVQLPTEEQEMQAKLTNAVELFPQTYKDLALAFILATGIFPIKADVAGWCKAFRDQETRTGLNVDDIAQACKQMYNDKLTIKDPFSVMGVAGNIHNDRKKKAIVEKEKTPNVVNTPFAQALETPVSPETQKTLEDFGKVLRARAAAKKRQPA